MSTLADDLRRRIADDGPLSVAQYMEEALTRPRLGYYMGRDPLGRSGDFITAPEISQMFGELIGLWCAVQWAGMGEPDPVQLVELGPGRGTMLTDVLRAGRGVEGFLDALSLTLVEISPALKSHQEEALVAAGISGTLRWSSDFSETPEGPLLLIANEFFDALPVRQFQMTSRGWRERLVGLADDGEGGFCFRLAEGPPPADIIPPGLESSDGGDIVEVRPEASALAGAIGRRLAHAPGAALIIDYGHASTAAGDTLQAVKGHAYHDPLADPGEADLTAHVDFGELGRAASDEGCQVFGPLDQGTFLETLGIGARAEALMEAAPEHRRDIAESLSRLTSKAQMGRLFKVLALTSPGMATPPGFE
ncbi:MAG: SAM-dependent methyltransferase [Proteobacteria bacterium]|nr:SAM-dependent methyltransferase [Pseudomonadota bacterium]